MEPQPPTQVAFGCNKVSAAKITGKNVCVIDPEKYVQYSTDCLEKNLNMSMDLNITDLSD